MFGKKKSVPKVEELEKENSESEKSKEQETKVNDSTEELLNEISPEENKDYEDEDDKYSSVKSKISRILKSSNIEIIDENEGDEYEFENDKDKEKQQHDYDELKAIFGGNNKDKKQELTLTIDDFDYTYTGEYLDEYDLVHIKNIKKIKLQHKHSKLIKRLAIAASVLIVVGVAITLSIVLTRKNSCIFKINISFKNRAKLLFKWKFWLYWNLYFGRILWWQGLKELSLAKIIFMIHRDMLKDQAMNLCSQMDKRQCYISNIKKNKHQSKFNILRKWNDQECLLKKVRG